MEKFLLNTKFLKTTLFITALFCTGTIFAQITIGNGQTVLAGDIAPGATVTINAGGTLEMNVAQSISSLTTANAGVSTISGPGALSVSAAITIAGANTLSVAPVIIAEDLSTEDLAGSIATVAGPGTITVDDITINGTNGNAATFIIGSGLTVQTGSIVSGNGNNQTEYTLVADGILKISDEVDNQGPGIDNFTCNAGSTVEYNGGDGQDIFVTNYHHLIVSGSGV